MDNNGILQGNQILFSYFSAPSGEEIPLVESWYRTDTAEQRFMAGAEALGLSRDDFEFEVRYIYDSTHFVMEDGVKKYPGQIQNGLRAKRDVIIPLEGKETISVKAGAFYPLLVSRRFAQEDINQLIQKAGGKVKYRVAGEGEELVMMAKKPRLYKKYQSKIAKSLLAVFLLGAGIGIKS
jgi:hypothetical protein